ncbi:MAG: Rpn family recombination-promoting nuclease/putative transposase, partial [Azoarcus sp.]|nr:Rpn family recombination-promoting nuclease/putative transposase [Azoarcus sp.]
MTMSHDARYRRLFSHAVAIRDLLARFAPGPWLRDADFSTLTRVNSSYVSGAGKQRHGDMVWRVKVAGRWLWIYIVLEFQRKPDPWMALRMLVYIGLLAQDLIRGHKKELPEGRLPPILPIVLYNGEAEWRAPIDVADCFVDPPGGLAAFRPSFKYHLIDGMRLRLHPLGKVRNFAEAILAMENSRTERDLHAALRALCELLAAPEMRPLAKDFEEWINAYLRHTVPASTIDRIQDILEGKGMLAERIGGWFEWALHVEERALHAEEKALHAEEQGEAKMLARLLARRFGPLPEWAEVRL